MNAGFEQLNADRGVEIIGKRNNRRVNIEAEQVTIVCEYTWNLEALGQPFCPCLIPFDECGNLTIVSANQASKMLEFCDCTATNDCYTQALLIHNRH
jgi:hypothetical protein